MWDCVGNNLADMPRPRAHDHDAVGEEDGFFDDVGDHHDALHIGDGGRAITVLRHVAAPTVDRLHSANFRR